MAENDPKHDETERIKKAYRANNLTFVIAMLDLRQAGHSPARAQKIVAELIKEKHNANLDN